MRSFINSVLYKFYSLIDKKYLALNYCFDLSDKNENMHWIDGNRQFFASGKYINGKKHGDFRKYCKDGIIEEWEIYEHGKLIFKNPDSC